MNESIIRFSDRVADYVRYRPSYPSEVVPLLKKNVGLTNSSVIADMGSGTGISTALFVNNGNKVYAIEPNEPMRNAADLLFTGKKNYTSINGTAEQTTLEDNSIDIIFSAQAFHWFRQQDAKREFKRILKDDGHIILVWNIRSEISDFQKSYEKMLRTLPEFNKVTQRNISDEDITAFFAPHKMHKAVLNNYQLLNLEGVKGRLLSSSYFPRSGTVHDTLMKETEQLFSLYHDNGLIQFDYETNIYWT